MPDVDLGGQCKIVAGLSYSEAFCQQRRWTVSSSLDSVLENPLTEAVAIRTGTNDFLGRHVSYLGGEIP